MTVRAASGGRNRMVQAFPLAAEDLAVRLVAISKLVSSPTDCARAKFLCLARSAR